MRLERLPKGLLDLLGQQNFGEAPKDVAASIDVLPFLAVGQVLVEGVNLTAGYAAGSYTAVGRVPQGVVRFLYDVSLTLELGAAQIGQLRLTTQATGNTSTAVRCGLTGVLGAAAAPGAAIAYGEAVHFSPPLFQPPGEEFGIEVYVAIPAGARVQVGLRYADYRAQG